MTTNPLADVIVGGVWRTRPVDDEPVITLTDWRIFSVPSLNGEGVDDHFCGYNAGHEGRGFWSGEGRVSSKIVNWDAAGMAGTTRSGRKYVLIGPPRYNSDAEYVYSRWLEINKVDPEDAQDVTMKYLNEEQKQTLNDN